MLSLKPWRTDAIMRLAVSVLICLFMGALLAPVVTFFGAAHHGKDFLFVVASLGGVIFFGLAVYFLMRSWRLETFRRTFIGLLVCVYLGFALGWWASRLQSGHVGPENSTVKIAFAVLSFQGAAIALVHFFLRQHGMTWAEAFGLKNNLRQALALGVFVMFSVLPICWLLQMVSGRVMELVHVEPQEQTAVQALRETEIWVNRLVLGIAAILIAPVAEEILFRGILYPAIKQRGHPHIALWGTAMLFGLIHFNVLTFMPLTLLALVLTWLYEKTDNLVAPITMHSLFNAANFVMIYALPWLAEKFPKFAPK